MPWYNDDDFWELLYPYMFPPQRFDAALDDILLLQALTGVTSGTVLDLGCGPGRFVVPLAKQGYTVTGVDRTAYLLDKARAYAAQECVEVELLQEDMRRFVRTGAFGLILNLFTTFGYFADSSDNQLVLDNVYTSLTDGGAFVVDVHGKETLAGIYRNADVESLDDGSMLVQQRRPVNDWCEMQSEWSLIRDGRARTFHVRHWIYSGWELKQMLLTAGFADVTLSGDLEGSPYGADAKRLVAVARK
jgi:SAM-dependent methyltransferase